jgi:hypothetical protein
VSHRIRSTVSSCVLLLLLPFPFSFDQEFELCRVHTACLLLLLALAFRRGTVLLALLLVLASFRIVPWVHHQRQYKVSLLSLSLFQRAFLFFATSPHEWRLIWMGANFRCVVLCSGVLILLVRGYPVARHFTRSSVCAYHETPSRGHQISGHLLYPCEGVVLGYR